MIMDKNSVLGFLPHRNPFLFIDEVVEIGNPNFSREDTFTTKELVGSKIIARFYTRKDHPIFEGHFPGNPILPGVVQIEMMAQASTFSVTLLKDRVFTSENLRVALLGVTSSKFRKPILPEMHLEIHSTCLKARGGFLNFQGQVYHNQELMSEADYMASIQI